MSVSGITSGSSKVSELGSTQGPRRPNVRALREALQAGDSDAAKAAFKKIYQSVRNAPTDAAHDGVASNVKRLVLAVDAGDISAAQAALNALDAERGGAGYGPGQLPAGVRQAGSDFLGLVQAIRSGDASVARTSLDQVRGDVKTLFQGHGTPVR